MINKKQKTLKLSMLVVLLLLIPSMLYAACTGSSPAWTTTPDYGSVSSCVTQANSGDTIDVLPGTATWGSMLTITKGIKLKGAGIDSTNITSNLANNQYLIVYQPASPASNEMFELTGFTFDMQVKSGGVYLYNKTTDRLTNIRIHHNRFLNSLSNTYPMLRIYGNTYGSFDNNIANRNLSSGTPVIEYVGNNIWNYYKPSYDPEDMQYRFYIEDNTIELSGSFIGTGRGSKYVVRYNTFNYIGPSSSSISPLFDQHGNQGIGMEAGMLAVAYGNILTSSNTNVYTLIMDFRGGMGLVYYNKTVGTNFSSKIRARDEYDDSITPINYIGADAPQIPQHVSNAYVWNNRSNSTLSTSEVYNGGSIGYYVLTENVDVWFQRGGQFDGTGGSNVGGGVGCGTLATMQAITKCTDGVGYWVTKQSCTTVDDANIGRNPSAPIVGDLYICSSNTWIKQYTPYTYPHPLRSSTASYTDNTQEPAPTTSVPPTIAVSPTIKDFGTLPINTSSPAQRFTVTTTGGNLNVDAISVTGIDATQFTIQNDSCTGKIIAPETGSCTFDVKFAPSTVGAKAANVAIVDNDSNTSKLIAVNGTGTSQIPAISFSPTSLSFSNVLSGTLSSPQTIRVSNTSTNFVTISSISLSGTYANQFSIPAATDYCTGETVAASGNCSFQVIFSPTSGGEKTANVNLTALYYSSPATLPLYGSAVVYQSPVPRIKISKIK